ncbi:uncharacterized protein LOC131849509 [Achroia grisella]|uniref:uncharacterized protein LOC131849509 n=1 Tax=Achroia grisella TaxID=688607 RepID=UPI0027D1EA99|nr:uncharacterized protein LOC131849509 [Achroia grisella]
MTEEDITKCYFIPKSVMEKVIEVTESPLEREYFLCKRNLWRMQKDKIEPLRLLQQSPTSRKFQLAIHRAIYSHNWNKLLYLLRKFPIWHHYQMCGGLNMDTMVIYIRALIILLMYHPTAKAKSLLHEYFHMICSCRTDVDKKALKKVLLSLPEKFMFIMNSIMKHQLNDDYSLKRDIFQL